MYKRIMLWYWATLWACAHRRRGEDVGEVV